MVNPDIKTATLRLRLNPLPFLFLLCFTGKTDQNGSAVVTVREDSDFVLPCSLATRENIELKLFDWIKRATKNDGQKEVFFYDAGIHYNNGRSGQSEEFKGRVSHFPEKLKHGDASIIIRNTKVTDSGNYTCHFPRLQPQQTFHIELVVEQELRDRTTENILGAASKPSVTALLQTGGGVLIKCEVRGAFPAPEVVWQDGSGNTLPAEEPQISERGGGFDIILQTTVTESGRYRCVATQAQIYHQIAADTDVFYYESTPGWIIAVFSVLCTLFVGVVLLAVLKFFGSITSSRSKGSQVPQS